MKELSHRQLEIVDQAIELIAEKSIQGLTIKNLSYKLGLSEGAIYRHFKSKHDILCTIINHINEHFAAAFESVKSIPSIEDRMQAFMDHHLVYFQNNPATAAVIFSEEIFQGNAELVQKVNRLVERRINIIAKFIETAQEEGRFRRDLIAEDMAYIFLGSLRFLVTAWRLGGFSYDLTTKGRSLKSTLLKLIG
jgi:AcrR family transcriptional regulator